MKEKLIVFISVMIFLRPHISFFPDALSVFAGDALIILLGIVTFLTYKIKIDLRDKIVLQVSCIVIVMLFIPTAINVLRTDSVSILLDYIKMMYYIFAFWIIYTLMMHINEPHLLIERIIKTTFVVILFVAIIQLLEVPILTILVKSLYGTDKLRSLWTGYPRVYSTFYNANWFGVYLVFYLSWINSKFSYKSLRLQTYIINLSIITMLIIISGSRTAVLGIIIVFVFQFINIKGIKKILTIIPFLIFVIPVFNILIQQVPKLGKTINRFKYVWYQIKNGNGIAELNPGRWDSWNYTLHEFKGNILLGTGYTEIITHNSYLYFLNTFGLIGAIIILPLLIVVFIKVRSNITIEPIGIIYKKWLLGFVPAFLIMSLTAEFIFTTQVMLLFIFILVVTLFPKKFEFS